MEQPSDHPASEVEMESEDEEAAMAAAMGFSGFGKAPATKKRKYNSKTDACIDGQELQNIDKGGKRGQGSGGNEVPLGRMRVLGASSVEEEQSGGQGYVEIGEGDVDEDRPMEERCWDTSRPAPAEEKLRNDARRAERRGKPMINEDEIMLDDEGDDSETALPQQSPGGIVAQDAQSKIDAIVAAPASEPAPALMSEIPDTPASALKPKQKQKQKQMPAQGLAAFMTALQTPVIPPPSIPPPPGTISAEAIIPPAPGTATTNHTYTTETASSLPQRPAQSAPSQGPRAAGGRGAKGLRNELWYVGYYDPSFNENPWKQLEKENGLASIGTWIERPARNR